MELSAVKSSDKKYITSVYEQCSLTEQVGIIGSGKKVFCFSSNGATKRLEQVKFPSSNIKEKSFAVKSYYNIYTKY